jgi:hypothetical protein
MNLSERMAKAFADLDDDGKRFWLDIVEEEAASVRAARRPVLRLIQGGPPAAAPTPKPRATTRTRTKEST